MKKIVAYISLALVLSAGYNMAAAQDGLQMKLGYNANMPVGSFKDFMGENSYRGFNGEISYPVNQRLRVGLGVAYNDYYEKIPRQTYQTKDGTISAVVTNSIQTTPILLKANYDLLKQSFIKPYIGIGAGFNLINFSQYFGEFNSGKTAFKPALSADAGVNIPFNRNRMGAGLNLGANFNYMPFKYNEVDNLNNVGVHLGVYFPLR